MAGQSDQTVVRLVNAAARHFADDGWRGADLATIADDAGLENESLVTYHFGSREGLLLEVIGRTLGAMEEYRREDLETMTEEVPVAELVAAVLRPGLELVVDPVHRDAIRVLAHFAGEVDVVKGVGIGPAQGLLLEDQFRILLSAVARELGDESLARERVRWFTVLSTVALATRGDDLNRWLSAVGGTDADADAAARVHGRQSHAEFAADMRTQFTAALLAPVAFAPR